MKQIFRNVLGMLLASLLWSASAYAFQFSPFSETMRPSGKRAIATFKAVNDSADPIAVEVSIQKRVMQQDGSDQLSEGEDDFTIFPTQFIVKPKSSQTIRVQWLGDANITVEKAYRIIAEQVPVDLEKREVGRGAQLQMMLRYVGSLYVQPENAKSHLIVTSLSKRKNEKGQNVLVVHVENNGTRHTIIEKAGLTITLASGTITLDEKQLQGLADQNILAKTSRSFEVPLPAALAATSFTGSEKAELIYRESY